MQESFRKMAVSSMWNTVEDYQLVEGSGENTDLSVACPPVISPGVLWWGRKSSRNLVSWDYLKSEGREARA